MGNYFAINRNLQAAASGFPSSYSPEKKLGIAIGCIKLVGEGQALSHTNYYSCVIYQSLSCTKAFTCPPAQGSSLKISLCMRVEMVFRGGKQQPAPHSSYGMGASVSEFWSRSWRSAASICSEVVELSHFFVSLEEMLPSASTGAGSAQQGQTHSPFPRGQSQNHYQRRDLQDQIPPLAKYHHPPSAALGVGVSRGSDAAGTPLHPNAAWGLHMTLELLWQSISLSSRSCLSGSLHCSWDSGKVLITLCSFLRWVLQCFLRFSWGISQNC